MLVELPDTLHPGDNDWSSGTKVRVRPVDANGDLVLGALIQGRHRVTETLGGAVIPWLADQYEYDPPDAYSENEPDFGPDLGDDWDLDLDIDFSGTGTSGSGGSGSGGSDSSNDNTTDRTHERDSELRDYPLVIRHFGNVIYDDTILGSSLEATPAEIYDYTVEVQVDDTFYPDEFTGVEGARWMGEELAVIWEPSRITPSTEHEVSVATEKEHLFTKESEGAVVDGAQTWSTQDEAGTTVAYTYAVEGALHYMVPRQPLMNDRFYVSVRRPEMTADQADVQTVQGYEAPSHGTGTDVTDVVLRASPEVVVSGDLLFVEAEVIGAGDPDPTVSFSGADGVEVVASGSTRGVVRVTEDGEVSATSNANEDVSDAVSLQATTTQDAIVGPTPIVNLRATQTGTEDTVYIRWNNPGKELATRFEFKDIVTSNDKGPVYDTTDTSLLVTNVTDPIQVYARHISTDGREGPEYPIGISPGTASADPSAFIMQTLPEIQIGPGQDFDLDPLSFLHVNDFDEEEDAEQEDLFAEADVQVTHVSGGTGIDVDDGELNSFSIGISGDVNLDASSSARDIVIIEILKEPHEPTFVAFPVTPSDSTGLTEAQSMSGIPAALSSLAEIDATRLCGPNPEVLTNSDWFPEIENEAAVAGASVSGDALTIEYDTQFNLKPVIVAVKGEDGVSLVCMKDAPPPIYAKPQLPASEIDRVERPDGYVDYAVALLQQSANPQQWMRLLTADGRLYELDLFEPPRELYYAPPIYFGDTWVNEPQYPDDAEIDFEAGTVVYRNGLTTPAADPASATVNELRLVPVPGGLDVSWDVEVQGADVTGVVGLTVTPSDDPEFTVTGDGSTKLRGLQPDQEYTVTLFDTSKTETPLHEKPDLKITAWRNADMSYHYVYESTATPDIFVDGFGDSYENPDFPVERDGKDASDEQEVRFEWYSGETQSVRAPVNWQFPPEPIQTTVEQEVGTNFPASLVELPTFTRPDYEGTSTAALPTNVYQPGTLRLEPAGHLPAGMPGEIEDYVNVFFVGPDSEELGPETEITVPTELGARAEVSAYKGQTPVFYGAYVTIWRTQ